MIISKIKALMKKFLKAKRTAVLPRNPLLSYAYFRYLMAVFQP